MFVVIGGKHKGCSALVMLTRQLGRPMSRAEEMLADLKTDLGQIKKNLGIEVDKKKGKVYNRKRNAD